MRRSQSLATYVLKGATVPAVIDGFTASFVTANQQKHRLRQAASYSSSSEKMTSPSAKGETQLRVIEKAKEKSTGTLISFHSSGLTCNQWRKLKNLWFQQNGISQFRPTSSKKGGGKDMPFQFNIEGLEKSTGPTSFLYLAEAPGPECLPDKFDLLSLYGQQHGMLVDHKDVEMRDLADVPLNFLLPASYLSFLFTRMEGIVEDSSKITPA